MNKQKPKAGIEWTHVHGRPGYTANPVRGCRHRCEWEMPDGQIVKCYAKAIAEKLAVKAYPNGFEHLSFHIEELAAIKDLESPAGIFIDSMSDLFGQKVPRDWIEKTIQTMRECPQHIFLSLTKNPSRFREFAASWPENWWVGVSAPPTFMFGKRLTLQQQLKWFSRALQFLADSPAHVRWVSLEPLSFDVSQLLLRHRRQSDDSLADFMPVLDWAVIGAGSNGAQPDAGVLSRTLDALRGLPVFFKGNLNRALVQSVGSDWREEFP